MISANSRIVRYVANFEKLGIPETTTWLTELESSELSFWKESSRRRQWLAGRWIAKRLVTRSSQTDMLREVEILSRGEDGLGKSPTVSIRGLGSPYRLSISHSNRTLLVGVTSGNAAIGVDVASGVPETNSFRTRWFSQQEAMWIESDIANRLPLAWALKESIFKAFGNGCKWDPRSVELVEINQNRIHSRIRGIEVEPLSMWIRTTKGVAATAVWNDTAIQEVSLCS